MQDCEIRNMYLESWINSQFSNQPKTAYFLNALINTNYWINQFVYKIQKDGLYWEFYRDQVWSITISDWND